MDKIKQYIADRGYICAPGLVENYYLSLMCRPFVILTGTGDTDLSELPELFASAVGATKENRRYKCLKVEYDWMDSSDLFGHLDLWGKFVPGAVMDFLKQAYNDPDHPYFLCFDKLILARAEYYLREILQIVEALSAGEDAPELVPAIYYGQDTEAMEKYGVIPALKNLYIIGTLNLDETSFPLNQKFMDRVHTLHVEKEDLICAEKTPAEPPEYNNTFLQAPICRLEQCGEYEEMTDGLIGVIDELNSILMGANAYVGYQVRNDMIVYLLNNHCVGVLDESAALDHLITRKVLVRAQGNAKTVQPVLEQLDRYCTGRYPMAQEKIAQMLKKCREEGYTAYWI